jgi:peptide deformylase
VTQAEEKGKRAASQERQLEVFLNAEIVSPGEEDGPYNEGCLSIPGVEGDVYRPLRIRVKWMDLEGNAHEEDVDGLRARVLQHEIDHLDGVLFVDHLGMIKRKLLAGRLNALRRETLKSLGLAETAG